MSAASIHADAQVITKAIMRRPTRRCATGPGDTIGRVGSKRDGGRTVEQPRQVAVHQPAQRVPYVPAVLTKLVDSRSEASRRRVE